MMRLAFGGRVEMGAAPVLDHFLPKRKLGYREGC